MTDCPVEDVPTALAVLRAAGAAQFDPVRFHYLEALARRSADHGAAVQRLLAPKLNSALVAFRTRFTQAPSSPLTETVTEAVARAPSLSALAALTRYLAQHSGESVTSDPGAVTELKAIRNFRTTWSQLSVEKQLGQAIEQAPENAGPLNSHMLVLRSLAMMRDISPDYLSRFMSYADTLLCLDQAAQKNRLSVAKVPGVAKPAAVAKPAEVPKPAKSGRRTKATKATTPRAAR